MKIAFNIFSKVSLLSMLTFSNFGCSSSNLKESAIKSIEVKPVWVTDTLSFKNEGFRKVNRSSPILYKDSVIVFNSLDGVGSYDIFNKSLIWKTSVKFGVESSAVLVDDNIYFGSLNGSFYCLSAIDGKITWTFNTQSELVAEPLYLNGLLYFITGSNALFSLDAKTGKQLWVYNRQETTNKMTIRGGSKPAFSQGLIYQGFSDGSLVAINASTGTPQWEVNLNKNSRFKDIDAGVVVDGDTLYVNSYDDKLYALSKSNGTILWKAEAGGSTAPLISGQYLIYGTSKGDLRALSKKDGQIIWLYKNFKGISTEPILHKGLIVVGDSAGSLLFLDLLTGSVKGSFDPGRGIMTKPTTDKNQNIYFVSGESNFYSVKVEEQNKVTIPYLVH